MSFVRAYSKHEASYIFRVKDMPLAKVAHSWGLLRLPRMPEARQNESDDVQWPAIDVSLPHPRVATEEMLTLCCAQWDTYAYADKTREQARKDAQEKSKKEETESKKRKRAKETVAWSRKQEEVERKEERRAKRVQKAKAVRAAKEEAQEAAPEADDDSASENEDWKTTLLEERARKRRPHANELSGSFEGLT